jgi:UDP:flavonoid glycosyltransferase YjiC (YdhE family)
MAASRRSDPEFALAQTHARLLFCWELGANYGHLSNLALLQHDLLEEGFELVFAVSNLQVAREVLGPDARIVQAPVWPDFVHRGSRVIVTGYSDILSLAGYAEPAILAPVVDAWRALFDLVKPDAVVIDHGPAAQLAVRIAGIAAIAVGSGFTLPPLDYPTFPPLRADLPPSIPEARLLHVAQNILRDRGVVNLPDSLPSVFRTDARLPIGLPELDPYRSFRRESFYAPAKGFAAPVAPLRTSLFAYLGSELPHISATIQAIGELDIPAIIYLRASTPAQVEYLRMRGKTILARPGDIGTILPRVSHVLSQGGAMLTSEALAAGRAQFLLTTHLESSLNARLLVGAGYGRTLAADSKEAALFGEHLRSFIADDELGVRTLRYAQLLAQRPLPSVADGLQVALSRHTT